MLDFKALETFVWVATLRSFRRAADKLNTTQPAVSIRIAQLETLLGVRLFERDRRSVAPTPKGLQLLDYAERLIRLRADMVEAVGDGAAMRGIVRLGVSETIVHTWLPTLIERVNAAYPNLALEIEVDNSADLNDRLVSKDLDLAFLLAPTENPAVRNRPLCSFPLAFVAAAKMKLPQRAIGLKDIARLPIVTFSRNTQPYVALRELCAREGLRPTIHASASLATVMRMMLDGIGIAVIPPAILHNVPAKGRPRVLRPPIELPPLHFAIAWPAAPNNPAAAKVAELAVGIAAKAVKAVA